MKTKFIAICAALVLVLAGCQNSDWGSKQTIGTGAGALAGGLAGSQLGSGSGQKWAIGAGVLLGALAGSEVGASLDRADRAYMGDAQKRAFAAPVGETIKWNNPESLNYGSYTTVRDGTSGEGNYCREFKQTIVVDGRNEVGHGTACQQPDGSWEIVNKY